MSRGADTLKVFDFGLLFQALAQSLKVGVLKVTGKQGEKFLHFSKGRLKAIYTKRSRIRIGRVLYNMRAIEQGDLARVLEEQQAGGFSQPLGEELLVRGLISAGDLAAAVLYQMTEELLEIFYWREYSYEFYSGPIEKVLDQLERQYTRVGGDQDVQELLLSVSRTVDEIEKFNRVTPSLRDIYELTIDPNEYLAGQDADEGLTQLLRLIDGQRDIREILKDMRMNRFEVLELLCRLRTEGRIRPKNAFELLMLAENQRRSLPPEKLVRVYERVRELGVEGFDVTLRLAQVHEEAGSGALAAACYEEHARNCLAGGDLGEAERSSRKAVALAPDSLDRRDLLVAVLGEQGRAEEQVRELSEMAAVCHGTGDHRREASALERALSLGSGDPMLLERYAEALAAQGRRRAAAGALLALARQRESAGDAAGMERAMRRAVEVRPEGFRVRALRIAHLLRERREAEAVEEAMRLVPLVAELCERRDRPPARYLLELRRRLQDLGLRDLAPILLIAEALARSGASAASKRIFQDAVATLTAEGRVSECRTVLERATAAFPEDAGLRESLAEALAALGTVREALDLLAGLARAARSAGDVATAERLYRRMLSAKPICPEAMEELAEVLLKENKEAEAARVLAQIGHLYRATGDKSRAAEHYDRACRLVPGEPEYLRSLAEALSDSLGMAESIESWERLMQVLRRRGEHAAAIDAGLRVALSKGGADRVGRDLEECYRALGARLREVGGSRV